MIIHAYLTDGFLENGKLFLESFKYHNGENTKIILDTRDLKNNEVKSLYGLYKNLEVKNSNINYKKLKEKTGIPIDKLKSFKKQVEKTSASKNNKIWKLFISVEDRYRDAVSKVFYENKNKDNYMVHMDIDFYFRKNIQDIFDFIEDHDISIRFRKKAISLNRMNRCVLGNMIGLKLDDKIDKFIKTWHEKINDIPLIYKPKGYGQGAIYYAYIEHKNSFKWGDIPPNLIPKNSNKNAYIWSANKGSNIANLKNFRKDFENFK